MIDAFDAVLIALMNGIDAHKAGMPLRVINGMDSCGSIQVYFACEIVSWLTCKVRFVRRLIRFHQCWTKRKLKPLIQLA